MGNLHGFDLLAKTKEDAMKIAERAKELEKELVLPSGFRFEGYTTEFEYYEYDGEYGIRYETYVEELCFLAMKIADAIAATFPEMKIHLFETWEGPVCREAISRNGVFFDLEQAKDENGNLMFDEAENAIFIYPDGFETEYNKGR